MKKSLKLGNHGEDIVIELLNNIGIAVKKNTNVETRLYYDLDCVMPLKKETNINFTIEVKNDDYSLKSGNITIEVHNTNKDKPSGLTATTADFWVIVRGKEIWITSTTTLRAFVNLNTPIKTIEQAGDKNARILLYKKEDILDVIFSRIDNSTHPYAVFYNLLTVGV